MYKILKSKAKEQEKVYTIPLPNLEEHRPCREPEIKQTDGSAQNQSAEVEQQKVQEKAKKILEEAGQKADAIIQEAEQKAKEMGKIAEQKQRETEAKAKESQEKAKELLGTVSKAKEKIMAQTESEIVRLSLNMAEAVIYKKVELDPRALLSIVQEAVRMINHEEKMTVQVHPSRLETIKENKDQLAHLLSEESTIRFLPDKNLAEGDCVVQGQYARVESYLKERVGQAVTLLQREITNEPSSND